MSLDRPAAYGPSGRSPLTPPGPRRSRCRTGRSRFQIAGHMPERSVTMGGNTHLQCRVLFFASVLVKFASTIRLATG